jgi:hypothetical protein
VGVSAEKTGEDNFEQMDLFTDAARIDKQEKLDRAADALRRRFGGAAVTRATLLTLLLLLVKAGDAGVSTPAFVTGMMAFALAMGNLAMAVRWTCTRKADAEDSNTFPQP